MIADGFCYEGKFKFKQSSKSKFNSLNYQKNTLSPYSNKNFQFYIKKTVIKFSKVIKPAVALPSQPSVYLTKIEL